jgi:hypothetical protein
MRPWNDGRDPIFEDTQMPKYIALLIVLLVGMQAPAQSDDLDEAYVNLFKLQLSLAKGGEANAQFGLGQMYEDGLGTDKDMTKALEWYGKAAKQGDIRAVKKLEDLSNPGQGIAKAAVRIAEPMKPKPVVTKETPKKVDEAAIRAGDGGQGQNDRSGKKTRGSQRIAGRKTRKRERPVRIRPGHGRRVGFDSTRDIMTSNYRVGSFSTINRSMPTATPLHPRRRQRRQRM